MGIPNYPDKFAEASIFTAADRLRLRQRQRTAPTFTAPETLILCFHRPLLDYAVMRQRGKKMAAFFGDFYMLRKTQGRVGIVGNFGVGAPGAAVVLEDFAAYGVEQFIALGTAGGLQEDAQAGDWLLVERAIRDEGTSHHYLPPAKYAAPSAALTQQLENLFEECGESYSVGTSWTTDAPYRETAAEVAHYQREGVQAVEMETAALYAVGQHLGVDVAALLVTADSISRGRWRLDFDERAVEDSLKDLLDLVLWSLVSEQ